jgi:ATP dependent DNA ligase-like protein
MLRSSTSLPGFIAPQTPVLSAEPLKGGGWIHEIKHDGYRTLLRNDRGQVQAFTRNGNDWSDRYARVIAAARNLRCRSALVDGNVNERLMPRRAIGISPCRKIRFRQFFSAAHLSKRKGRLCQPLRIVRGTISEFYDAKPGSMRNCISAADCIKFVEQ